MCATCGCGPEAREHERPHVHDHAHPHAHDHVHPHADGHAPRAERAVVALERKILAKNDALARRNRERLARAGAVAVNVLSSPGSGKTTLLERSVGVIALRRPVAVVEGDQQTDLDAARIRAAGARAFQINTGAGCHLDAAMVERALDGLAPLDGALVLIENVGNLVCPALFDLGESARVVVASVTEGEEKPAKYPAMFRGADLVVLNKVDLLPHVDFRRDAFEGWLRRVNPRAAVLPVSARTGEGLDAWHRWLGRAGRGEHG